MAALKNEDSNLNRIYRKTLKKLGPEDASRLRKAQRAWLAYRDAHCDAEVKLYEGGSITHIVLPQCRLTLTKNRAEEIQETYDNGQ